MEKVVQVPFIETKIDVVEDKIPYVEQKFNEVILNV